MCVNVSPKRSSIISQLMLIFKVIYITIEKYRLHGFKSVVTIEGMMESIRWMLKSKIHRAKVTQADLDYIGSISIDEDLLDAAGIAEWEKVSVLDVTNGSRLETYAIKAPRGSGEICINGAAAHLVNPGDIVILLTFIGIKDDQISSHQPCIVHVNEGNQIIELVSVENNY